MQLKPIIDGFVYSGSQRRSPHSYDTLALGQLELLRRANGYTPRILAVPEWTSGVIGPYETIQQQIQVPPGSYLWSITNTVVVDPLSFVVTVRDDSTGAELFPFTSDGMFRNGGSTLPSNQFPTQVNPKLTTPYLISGNGSLTVRVSNTNPTQTAQLVQFIFQFAVPCVTPAQATEGDPCK